MQLIQYKKLFQIHFHFQWTDPIPMFPGSSRTWQYQYINIDININIETNININISGSSGTWQTLSQQRSAPAAQAPPCRSPSVCWKRKTRLVSQKMFFFHGRWIHNCWDFFLAKRVYVKLVILKQCLKDCEWLSVSVHNMVGHVYLIQMLIHSVISLLFCRHSPHQRQ